MSAKDGKPCKKCGGNEWSGRGDCLPCHRKRKRQWQEDNPDKNAAYVLRWKSSHPDKVSEYDRRSKRNNAATQIANKHRRRTRKTRAGGSYTAAEWRALVNHYGNKCLRCGRDDVKLTADHIVPISKGGTSNIDNIQPLCFSCNSSKCDKTIDYRPDKGVGRWIQRKLFG